MFMILFGFVKMQEGGGVPMPTAAGMVNADGTPLQVDPADMFHVPQGGVFSLVSCGAVCQFVSGRALFGVRKDARRCWGDVRDSARVGSVDSSGLPCELAPARDWQQRRAALRSCAAGTWGPRAAHDLTVATLLRLPQVPASL
jgi:hypothetical protein